MPRRYSTSGLKLCRQGNTPAQFGDHKSQHHASGNCQATFLSDLSSQLQEHMEDYIASFVPKHRMLYHWFDVWPACASQELLRTVDATETDTFRVNVMQHFDGVTVEDTNHWAGEVGKSSTGKP